MTAATLAQDERLPLYQRLRDELAARIASAEWRPGEAIPTESELTKRYGIATGTVRKAVDALVADGLLERSQGRGTFVRRPSFDASLFRFFRHQGAGGERQVPASRILERALRIAPAPVVAALDLPARVKAIRLQRLRSLDGKPVLAEEIWLPFERFGALLDLSVAEFGDLLYPLYESRCGQVVASAQETLTVEAADAAVAKLLERRVGDPIVVVERLALGYDRQPLEWRRSRGPAEGFRYQVDIR